MLLVQSAWWAFRHIAWLRHPVMIPIVIFIAAMIGVTPTGIADTVMEVCQKGMNVTWTWVRNLSLTWFLGPWLWFFPVIFSLVWLCYRPGSNRLDPESEDSLRTGSRKHHWSFHFWELDMARLSPPLLWSKSPLPHHHSRRAWDAPTNLLSRHHL